MNIDDMLADDRPKRLLEIFQRRLWKGGRDVHITLVESVVAMGGRRPNSREKEGVIVRIGSVDYFSRELLNLNREVMKLHERGPCRKEKKTSAERFFRDEELIPDWCGFKLWNETIVKYQGGSAGHEPAYSPIHLGSSDFHPPPMMLASRNLLFDFLICVILPAVMALASASTLSFIMFGRREGVEKRNRDTPSIQMVQYASIHRASNNLRSLTSKRDNCPTPVVTTPSSTLNRSYAGSPNNTLTKENHIKKSDDVSKAISAAKPDPSYGFPNQHFESPQKIIA